ncbi:MAG: Peptidoglycan D,D-transpeptidase MrdA [Chloroflexi bacterium]|nr:Peptidoglycan D,D-transpeptidase MrdA [Chloroflexota bacterium]
MSSSSAVQNQLETRRILAFIILVGAIFLLYIIRLVGLQILSGREWMSKAEENRLQEISLAPERGVIFDRNGTVLARNVPSYNVIVTAAFLPDDVGAIQNIIRDLSEYIEVPVNQGEISPENPFVPCRSEHGITQVVGYGQQSAPFREVKIACNIDKTMARLLQEKAVDWPGISIEVEPVRDYPTGSLTANFIGFLGPISALNEEYYTERGFVAQRDKVGYAGLERYFEAILSGKPGKRLVEVDVAGKIVRDVIGTISTIPGQNIYTTIDTRLQQAAQSVLLGEIRGWNAYFGEIRLTSGVVIAIDPQTGEILAMVSYPTYENNRMARVIPAYYYEQLNADVRDPLLNHAVGAALPAGSVFKLSTAVGALNEGVVTPDQVISTPPKIITTEKFTPNDPGRSREFVDWNEAGFGSLDFIHGLANSSNVYFYQLGGGTSGVTNVPNDVPDGLGICRLGTYAHALGYGELPGIELPDETDGLIPTPKWKRIAHGENWSTGDTYIASVGQGFVISSPLQVLMSAATIANDGKLMRPTILYEIEDSEGNTIQPFQPDLKWDITQDPIIDVYSDPTSAGGCEAKLTGEKTTVAPWVVEQVQIGMRLAVANGTLEDTFEGFDIAAAGKTGTAEYCDEFANEKGLCKPGNWPTHSWTVAYAPYENPEIAVVAFVYNGGEGASVAGPIVRQTIEAYFELKTIDSRLGNP